MATMKALMSAVTSGVCVCVLCVLSAGSAANDIGHTACEIIALEQTCVRGIFKADASRDISASNVSTRACGAGASTYTSGPHPLLCQLAAAFIK